MTTSDYAHCITGRPSTRVLVRGAPLVRRDTIQHRDGSLWRYDCLVANNRAVAATPLDGPDAMRRFSMEDFEITIEKPAESA